MPAETIGARVQIDATHPAFAGHFPGDPLLPAAVLLRSIGQALERQGRRLTAVERIKFLRPVRPGETIDVTLTPVSELSGHVEITVDATPVVRGEWEAIPD